uniref:Uncharacterized protein n=1 Tax=Meloidogyne enterolobii TaxID=390850 RepID=A0A6V7TTB5_MELEN|nr:unnamed protein product [Meloidogyne enterolobii]
MLAVLYDPIMFFQIRKFQNYFQKCLFYLLISNILFSNILLYVNGTRINSSNFNEFEGEGIQYTTEMDDYMKKNVTNWD